MFQRDTLDNYALLQENRTLLDRMNIGRSSSYCWWMYQQDKECRMNYPLRKTSQLDTRNKWKLLKEKRCPLYMVHMHFLSY